MHWQLGGNFGPVLKACEYRWMECTYALAHYIWFEVVTDVADSLANELILWRILAVVLIFMTIIHFMYWKKQWIKEINITNETLKKIDFKVQDLELKINILTYKVQYDTWPLMQLLKLNNESVSESNPSIFPKLNAQNAYLKYFLARTRRKKIENKALTYNTQPQSLLSELNVCDVKAKCISSKFNDKLMQQTSYIEQKLSLTSLEQKRVKTVNDVDFVENQSNNKGFKNKSSTINLSEEPTTDENFKLYRSSSDSSLNDHLRSTYLGSKKITKINVKPGKLLHRKRISPEIAEKQLKFSVSSTNNSSSSKDVLFPKFLKQNHSSYQDNYPKEETHETLNQVKKKLQHLHSTLRNYSNEFESNTLNTSHSSNKICDNFKKANITEAKNKYSYIKNQQGDCNFEECISLINDSDMIKEDKISNISSQANENDNEQLKKTDNFNSFAVSNELSSIHTENESNLLQSNTTSNGYCIEPDETKKNLPNHSRVQIKEITTDPDNNQQLSLETSKESDSDDKSISALIQEALKFKQELLLQFESRKEKDEINNQSIRNQSEPYEYSNWHSDSDFEPNSLDKITEESSGSSVVDKKSKTHILITAEDCNNIENENYLKCENQNTSNDNISLVTDSAQSKASVGKIIIETIDSLSQYSSSNQIFENSSSNKRINSNETILTDSKKQTQDEPKSVSQNSEEISYSNLNKNLKVDSNFNLLSDTSSDTSVNRLLDRLIESERKCKSAKSLTNSKIKEDVGDSLNTFIIPHTFFDNVPFESQQNSLPVEFGAERHFAEKIDSGIGSYENKNFDSTSLNTDEIQESETMQRVYNVTRENSKPNTGDTTDLNTFQMEDNEITECLYDSHNTVDQHFDKDAYFNVNDNNVTALAKNNDDSINVVKSISKFQNDDMKNENIVDKKDAGDFYSDSEIIPEKITQNSKKNVFPSGDSNSQESNTFPKGAVKLKSNMYHSSCKGQTGSNFQTGFKNSEQCSTKVQKNSSSNSIQRQLAKTNFEVGNSKQLKAKSYLNLTSIEHVNVLPAHRRSKSHATSCDIPLMNQNNREESENIAKQSDAQLENHDKKMEKEKDNLYTSLESSKKSFSKPCTPQSSRNCSADIEIQFQMKENNSSLSSKSSSKSSIPILLKDSNVENNCNKNEITRKLSNESVSSKSSTKSCIPILKTRLELVIKDDNDFHPKSLSTGSLNMNVECFRPEEIINSLQENIVTQENQNLTELIDRKNITFRNSSDAFKVEYGSDSHDYVSTYINTMIDDIQLKIDTNNEKQTFDEYEREIVKHTDSNDQINPVFLEDKEVLLVPKQDALLDCLVRPNDDLTNVISSEICSLGVQSTSSRVLSHKDSKETEVLAKPCTLDSSTSMTDIPSLKNASDSKANELQKLEVPEQLTKEEYATLLQLINEHPDFEHLLNLGLQK